eukprot:7110348-Prymnesium_polylepis.1
MQVCAASSTRAFTRGTPPAYLGRVVPSVHSSSRSRRRTCQRNFAWRSANRLSHIGRVLTRPSLVPLVPCYLPRRMCFTPNLSGAGTRTDILLGTCGGRAIACSPHLSTDWYHLCLASCLRIRLRLATGTVGAGCGLRRAEDCATHMPRA